MILLNLDNIHIVIVNLNPYLPKCLFVCYMVFVYLSRLHPTYLLTCKVQIVMLMLVMFHPLLLHESRETPLCGSQSWPVRCCLYLGNNAFHGIISVGEKGIAQFPCFSFSLYYLCIRFEFGSLLPRLVH